MAKVIFFVDDDKMILNLLEYTFNKNEFDIQTFKSGEECLSEIKIKNPDVVVLDYNFETTKSNLTGMDVLVKIREMGKEMPVIMLSSQEDTDLIPELINKGATKYIRKDSFFIDSLIDSIETVTQVG